MKAAAFALAGAALLIPALVLADRAALRLPEQAPDPRIDFEKYTLPNGLEVILVPDKSVPLVAVTVWYHVGSGNETYGKSGFAHLFEHMLFQGSKNVGVDKHFEILTQIGKTNVNGTTNPDRTNYYEVVPSNQLATALWLESDRMGYLLQPPKTVDDPANHFGKSLANQIDVVRNERRQNYDNVPYGKTRFAVSMGLYPEGHPYRYLTIGKHEDLTSATIDDVKNFFKTWYVPANATLAIGGDFDTAEAKKLVDQWFGKFPKSTKPAVVPVVAPAIKSKEVVVEDNFAKLRQVQFVWHSPANFAAGDAELDIAADALSRTGPGRLYRELTYKGLAQSVSTYQGGSGFSGQFQIAVTLRGDSDLAVIKKVVMEEVSKLAKETLSDKEIARVVAANEAAMIARFETAFGRAETLQAYNHYLGNPDRVSWDLDRYRKTTAENIRATVAKYLTPSNVLVVITNPSTAGAQ
ncbi:MAG: insulinase family protein [Deltaproteobacteria bacterium]|nr:insulinase family protein [Deltaproteobacteria bacterium]